MSRKSAQIAYARLAVAGTVVVAIVAGVPAADAALSAAGLTGGGGVSDGADAGIGSGRPPDKAGIDSGRLLDEVGIGSGRLLDAASIDELLELVEDAASVRTAEADAPSWFRDEVGFVTGAQDVRFDAQGTIVGYVVEGRSAGVFQELRTMMTSKGWTFVELGQSDGATFVKQSGRCTWALATCTQVGTSVSVVVRCALS